jgi:ribonuclease P protein component
MKRSDGLAVYASPGGAGGNRYGFVVTSKVGHAVVRNKVRRWAKELIRRWDASLSHDYELVVLANRPEAAQDFGFFASHLAKALRGLEVVEGELVY